MKRAINKTMGGYCAVFQSFISCRIERQLVFFFFSLFQLNVIVDSSKAFCQLVNDYGFFHNHGKSNTQ